MNENMQTSACGYGENGCGEYNNGYGYNNCGGCGFGGGWIWWIIIIFVLLCFFCGGFGWGC